MAVWLAQWVSSSNGHGSGRVGISGNLATRAGRDRLFWLGGGGGGGGGARGGGGGGAPPPPPGAGGGG
eukprot:SAG31_NODE_7786_length_1596_cov_3.189045_1_plen_67_part_10